MQQFKEESAETVKTSVKRVSSEEQTTPLVETTITVTGRNAGQGPSWPYFAIGAFVLLSAAVSFAVSLHRQPLSLEAELSVARSSGIDSLANFYDLFFVFAGSLVVAVIYILYGLWLRKHGDSGRLPAFLSWMTRRYKTSSNKDRAIMAWTMRVSIAFMVTVSTWFSLLPLYDESRMNIRVGLPPILLDRYLSTTNSIIQSLAMFGLLLILANTIYPLRGPKKDQ
jgi:hypothetical protein